MRITTSLDFSMKNSKRQCVKQNTKFISRSTAAEILGCSYRHVQRLEERGLLRRMVLPGSKRPRYLRSEVVSLVQPEALG